MKIAAANEAEFTNSVWRRWLDRFIGSDPGLTRLRMAFQSVLTIAVILGAESLFVHFTHALQIQTPGASLPAAAAQVAMANHEFLIIAMLLGAIIGMISSFGVMDATAKGQLVTMLLLPVAMVPALTFGIAIGGDRIIALASLAVFLAGGTYLRRFGPRGFIAGILLFMGDFFGYFLHTAVTLGDLGWLVAEVGVGLVVAIIIRFVFFYPNQVKSLTRTQRSYNARVRKVADKALTLFDDPGHSERDVRLLHRQLVRLNEAALMIDAQLGNPGAVAKNASAELLHQRLFDIELALTNIARFAQAMTRLELPDNQRSEARQALFDIVQRKPKAAKNHATKLIELLASTELSSSDEDRMVIVPHRFAGSIIALADGLDEWAKLDTAGKDVAEFQPSVTLFGGWLPGSSQVSNAASTQSSDRPGERIGLERYSRTAIQMGIAVGAAIVLGDIVSGTRFYWAVIAAFITFMGTNNSGEQIRKALYRVVGTVVGIGLGSLLVDAVGHNGTWSLVIILGSLFLGFYLIRISYAFMVIAITVMVAQLYVQLGEFSNSLLLLRLEETAIGAAVAIVVVLLVFPLHTRRVLRVALRDHIQALVRLVEHASNQLLDKNHQAETTLRSDARAIDASYQALITTAQPLRRNLFGSFDEETAQIIHLAAASRNYSRNLVADVEASGPLDSEMRQDVKRANATLHTSLEVVAEAIAGPKSGTYTRSAALLDRTERRLEKHATGIKKSQLAIRDFKLIDGVAAQIAEILKLRITDYDTVNIE